MFEAVFLSGARAGAVLTMPSHASAGRSPECDIEVPDPNVSRHHAQFEFDGTTLTVADNGSSNGTYVNEQRITEVLTLGHGDMVRLGETRIRIQRRTQRNTHSSSDDANSSVFGFSDTGADLSQSISMSMLDINLKEGNFRADDLEARLNLVLWVSEQLADIKTMDEIYGPILETLFDVFPQVDRGFLMLGSEWEALVPKAMRARDGKPIEGQAISSTLCREALKRKEIITYSESGANDFDQGMSIVQLDIRCAMVVPLMVKDEVMGLLTVDTRHANQEFSQDDMKLAEAVCRQIAIAIKYTLVLEDLDRETRTRSNLSRFLPKPVVDQAVDGQLDLRLGGSACRGTIFFADVIGFTRMSEAMPPEDVVAMMNGFFNRMVPVIESQNGAIDKFMGDCIMAFWGIPFDHGDSAYRSVTAGLMMQNVLCGLNSHRLHVGKTPLYMGVGLNTGEVVAGNIGTEDRVEYTVLGNTVNTAQRIQSASCKGQVLLGIETWNELGGKGYGIKLPEVPMKNKAEPVPVVSMRGLQADTEVVLHVPVTINGSHEGILTRRLSDEQFVLLHDRDIDPDGCEVISALPEWPDHSFGTAEVKVRLPDQTTDGILKRSQVILTDITLDGLISAEQTTEPLSCQLTWEDLNRAQSVAAE